MGKHSNVSSSTKWRLGESVSLWLMECLSPTVSFDIFLDNYFTSFRLLTHLGVNNIRATRMFSKNRLRKCTIIGDKHLQKKQRGHFEQCKSSKKVVQLGWNNRSAIDIASSESCEPKRFVWCCNKVEKKTIFEYNNQISFTFTTRTWALSREWTRTWPSIGIRMTKWLPGAIWTQACSELLYASKRECFSVNS